MHKTVKRRVAASVVQLSVNCRGVCVRKSICVIV